MPNIVVVGAGQAGASCVAKLRNSGFEGNITLIGAEPVAPYQRPPLSKAYLLGEMEEARLYLRPGDVIEAEIEGIGVLRNPVVSWQDAHGAPPPPRIRPWGDA